MIKVHAVSVNGPDVVQRTGNYPVSPGMSDLPGLEIAGGIIEDGGRAWTPSIRDDIRMKNVVRWEALNAERGSNYRVEDVVEVVKSATGGKGVDAILDMVGGDYIAREIACLADDGRLVAIALLGGVKGIVDMAQNLHRRLTITGSTLRPRSVEFKVAIVTNLRRQIWPLLENGAIKPVIYRTFPFEEAAQAYVLMEAGTHIGKIMLKVI